MNMTCGICGLPIDNSDLRRGCISVYKGGRAHAHCKILLSGQAPTCPTPSDTPVRCNMGYQWIPSEKPEECWCEKNGCSLGQSLSILREKGLIPQESKILKEDQDSATYSEQESKVEWTKVYQFLTELSSHSTYAPFFVIDKLSECGLQTKVLPRMGGLGIFDQTVRLVEPDYGSPGIWSLHLAQALYAVATGNWYSSPYSGRGFQYDDVLEKFKGFIEAKNITNNSA